MISDGWIGCFQVLTFFGGVIGMGTLAVIILHKVIK